MHRDRSHTGDIIFVQEEMLKQECSKTTNSGTMISQGDTHLNKKATNHSCYIHVQL